MLCLALSLFFVERDEVVLASGGYEGVRGLFNLVNSWV